MTWHDSNNTTSSHIISQPTTRHHVPHHRTIHQDWFARHRNTTAHQHATTRRNGSFIIFKSWFGHLTASSTIFCEVFEIVAFTFCLLICSRQTAQADLLSTIQLWKSENFGHQPWLCKEQMTSCGISHLILLFLRLCNVSRLKRLLNSIRGQ